MSRKLITIAAITMVIEFTTAAYAADKHGHDHDHKSMYGGIVAEAADLNFELVAKADSLTLYVADHGKPVATAGAKGAAVVHAGNDKTNVALEPAGENRLVAKGGFKVGVGVRVTATVMLPGKTETKLSFRLK